MKLTKTRIFALLLTLMMVFALVACSDSINNNSGDGNSIPPASNTPSSENTETLASGTPSDGEDTLPSEEPTIPGLLYEQPSGGLYILGNFTEDSLHPFYYVPEDEVISDLTSLITDLNIQELAPGWGEGLQPLLGCYLVCEDTWWEIWNNGIVVSRMSADGGYAEAPELTEKILALVCDKLGITPFNPSAIQDIVSARLELQFLGDDKKYTQTITDVKVLTDIESMLSGAENYDSGCPFYEAYMTLTLANGEEVLLAVASDSCCTYFVNGQGFNYKPAHLRGKEDSGYNDMLFKYFDQIPVENRP